MTDETKKLFDAPWRTANSDYVKDADDHFVCEAETHEHAERIARLPELYDKLMEAKNEIFIILSEGALGKSEADYLAFFNEIQELLKKVRDGE